MQRRTILAIAASGGGCLLLVLLACGGVLLFLFTRGKPRPPREVGEVARAGDIFVEVKDGRVGRVSGTSPAGRQVDSDTDVLRLTIHLLNKNPARAVPYRSWLGEPAVLLTDDLGTEYPQVGFRAEWGDRAVPDGHVASADIYSDRNVTDVLLFQRPVPAAKFLLLRLPAENVGGSGWLWLKIPREKYAPPR